MENFDEEISSIDEESYSLLNNESTYEKKSDDINDYDDNEDTRSELKFERSNIFQLPLIILQVKIFSNGIGRRG